MIPMEIVKPKRTTTFMCILRTHLTTGHIAHQPTNIHSLPRAHRHTLAGLQLHDRHDHNTTRVSSHQHFALRGIEYRYRGAGMDILDFNAHHEGQRLPGKRERRNTGGLRSSLGFFLFFVSRGGRQALLWRASLVCGSVYMHFVFVYATAVVDIEDV